MNRRTFLLKTAFWGLGGLIGLPGIGRGQCALPAVSSATQPRIAIIIDDIGSSLNRTRQFLNIDLPITFAVLPRLAHSKESAVEIFQTGREVLLHQPMEPFDPKIDPGPGALYVGDDAETILSVVEENLFKIPHAVGMNNHMGSRLTASPEEIQTALEVIKKQALFFVDSVTSYRSLAYDTAVELEINSARRDIFLDNDLGFDAIAAQIHRLLYRAIKFGYAVGIGHPHPQTLWALSQLAGVLRDSEFKTVPVSEVLNLDHA